MHLRETEVSQDTSSLARSTSDGSPLFVQVRPLEVGDLESESPLTLFAVWLACTLSFILGLPSLGSSVAFAAATSIATIGLYISYGKVYNLINILYLAQASGRCQVSPLRFVSSTETPLCEGLSTSAAFRTPSPLEL
jgi:hypothetical protein